MERGGGGSQAGKGVSAPRRPRNSPQKDPSAEGMVGEKQSSRLRERPKKDQTSTTPKNMSENISSNGRSKRKRSDLNQQSKADSLCGDAPHQSLHAANHEDQSCPPLSSAKAHTQDNVDHTAPGGLSSDFPYVPKIPRRLRTAMVKRAHEVCQSAMVEDCEEAVRSNGKVNCSNEISDEEVEVMEALFRLANQGSHPPPPYRNSDSGVKIHHPGTEAKAEDEASLLHTKPQASSSPAASAALPSNELTEQASDLNTLQNVPVAMKLDDTSLTTALPLPISHLSAVDPVADPSHDMIQSSDHISEQKVEANAEGKEDGDSLAPKQDVLSEMPLHLDNEDKDVPVRSKVQIDLMAFPCADGLCSSSDIGTGLESSGLKREQIKDPKDFYKESQMQISDNKELVSPKMEGQAQSRLLGGTEQTFSQDHEAEKSSALKTCLSKGRPESYSPLPRHTNQQYDVASASWPRITESLKWAASASETGSISTQLLLKSGAATHVRIAHFIKFQQNLEKEPAFPHSAGCLPLEKGFYCMQAPSNTSKNPVDILRERSLVGNIGRLSSGSNLLEENTAMSLSQPFSGERENSKGALLTPSLDVLQLNQQSSIAQLFGSQNYSMNMPAVQAENFQSILKNDQSLRSLSSRGNPENVLNASWSDILQPGHMLQAASQLRQYDPLSGSRQPLCLLRGAAFSVDACTANKESEVKRSNPASDFTEAQNLLRKQMIGSCSPISTADFSSFSQKLPVPAFLRGKAASEDALPLTLGAIISNGQALDLHSLAAGARNGHLPGSASSLNLVSKPKLPIAVERSLSPPLQQKILEEMYRKQASGPPSSVCFLRADVPVHDTSIEGLKQHTQLFPPIFSQSSHAAAAMAIRFPKLFQEQAQSQDQPFSSLEKTVICEQSQLHLKNAVSQRQQRPAHTQVPPHAKLNALSQCLPQPLQQAQSSSFSTEHSSLTGSEALIANHSRSGSYESVCSVQRFNTVKQPDTSTDSHRPVLAISDRESIQKNLSNEQKSEIADLQGPAQLAAVAVVAT